MATEFDLGGLLGSAFGGTSEDYSDLFTPAQQEAIRNRSLLSAAAALLQAGGPSKTPTSLGQALGSAMTAGQTSAEQAQQSALAGMLTRQKIDEARRAQELQKRIASILTPTAAMPTAGAAITPEMALSAPVTEGMPAGPTVARAEMIGQAAPAAPAMSPNEMRAQQYRQIADVYAASGRGEDAKRYMDIAENLAPSRREVVGQPFEVTSAEGKPVMVQQFKDGSIQTVAGFGPKREVVLQNVDGQVRAIDKSQLGGGEVFGTGMSPLDRAKLEIEQAQLRIAQQRLGLSQAEFTRGNYERMETSQGLMYVPKTPGYAPIPITDAAGNPLVGAGGKPTEGESNAAGFAQRMERSIDVISNLPPSSQPGTRAAVAGMIPLIGGVAQRRAMTPEQQQYKQAADDWIRAKLRKESGAAIGVDEMQREYETYFPQIGDTPEVIAQKAEARSIATNAMKISAGKSYKPYVPAPKPEGAAPQEGATSKDRSGRAIIYRNGQWVYQ